MAQAYNLYLIGIRELDEEHEDMLRLTREIGNAVISQRSEHELLALLDRFIFAAQSHFAHEEEIFAPYRLPGEQRHKEEHQALLEQIAAARNKIAEGYDGKMRKPLLKLADIVNRHVISFDMEIQPHLDS